MDQDERESRSSPALPVSGGFIDWRSAGDEALRARFTLPYEDICFDIEHNEFWLRSWGSDHLVSETLSR